MLAANKMAKLKLSFSVFCLHNTFFKQSMSIPDLIESKSKGLVEHGLYKVKVSQEGLICHGPNISTSQTTVTKNSDARTEYYYAILTFLLLELSYS